MGGPHAAREQHGDDDDGEQRGQLQHHGDELEFAGRPRAGEVDERHRPDQRDRKHRRSEEHTSELQSLMRISYAVFCLKKKNKTTNRNQTHTHTTQQSPQTTYPLQHTNYHKTSTKTNRKN